MKIIPFEKKFRKDFVELNKAWIEEYFVMEADDYEMLDNVEKHLSQGAQIFFAVEDDTVAATCMTVPLGNDVWEICKLASNKAFRGRGAGSAVFKACMDYAKANRAKKIIIISNRILKSALHIYEKFGFTEVPVDKTHDYSRADIQFEYSVSS